jgi:hypothetical protein
MAIVRAVISLAVIVAGVVHSVARKVAPATTFTAPAWQLSG